jgi:hypothetical protein
MDTRQIICCLRDVGSFLGVFASDMLPKYPTPRSGTLIVNAYPHTQFALASYPYPITFLPFLLFRRLWSTSIHSGHSHSSTETALSGITTRYSYKALRQPSVANIAVSWRCIWILVTRLKNSLGSFLAPVIPINGCPNYLRWSLAHYPKYYRETGNITPV